jgi:putative NADH-flavin reductase
MHFLLLGATGRTGKQVLTELLSQGHTAVALIRPTASLISRPGLTIVTGSPLSRSDIQSALTAAPSLRPDAAIYTLNAVRKTESPFAPQLSPPRFLADSCAATCDILEQAGIRRIVVMSTAGAGDSWVNLPWLSKAFMGWTNVKLALLDHNDVDKEIRETNMEWTLVRAVRLEFGVEDDKKGSGERNNKVTTLNGAGVGMKVTDSISVDSAARFLVKCAVEGRYIREAVVIRD